MKYNYYDAIYEQMNDYVNGNGGRGNDSFGFLNCRYDDNFDDFKSDVMNELHDDEMLNYIVRADVSDEFLKNEVREAVLDNLDILNDMMDSTNSEKIDELLANKNYAVLDLNMREFLLPHVIDSYVRNEEGTLEDKWLYYCDDAIKDSIYSDVEDALDNIVSNGIKYFETTSPFNEWNEFVDINDFCDCLNDAMVAENSNQYSFLKEYNKEMVNDWLSECADECMNNHDDDIQDLYNNYCERLQEIMENDEDYEPECEEDY